MKKKKLFKLLKNLDKQSKKIYNMKLKYKIHIDLESTQTIGYFAFRNNRNHLNFNRNIFNQSSFKNFKEVIIHEYAHMLTRQVFGRVQAHGPEWKSVMRMFGIMNPSATTTSFINIKKKESDILVSCKCGSRYLSSNRATRMKNGSKYFCAKCSKKLKLKKGN